MTAALLLLLLLLKSEGARVLAADTVPMPLRGDGPEVPQGNPYVLKIASDPKRAHVQILELQTGTTALKNAEICGKFGGKWGAVLLGQMGRKTCHGIYFDH